MSAKTKSYMVTAGIALVIAALVVWASNNIDSVENLLD